MQGTGQRLIGGAYCPDSIVPNNAMKLDVTKAADRRDNIASLKQESQ
jgi:hypothetical protein